MEEAASIQAKISREERRRLIEKTNALIGGYNPKISALEKKQAESILPDSDLAEFKKLLAKRDALKRIYDWAKADNSSEETLKQFLQPYHDRHPAMAGDYSSTKKIIHTLRTTLGIDPAINGLFPEATIHAPAPRKPTPPGFYLRQHRRMLDSYRKRLEDDIAAWNKRVTTARDIKDQDGVAKATKQFNGKSYQLNALEKIQQLKDAFALEKYYNTFKEGKDPEGVPPNHIAGLKSIDGAMESLVRLLEVLVKSTMCDNTYIRFDLTAHRESLNADVRSDQRCLFTPTQKDEILELRDHLLYKVNQEDHKDMESRRSSYENPLRFWKMELNITAPANPNRKRKLDKIRFLNFLCSPTLTLKQLHLAAQLCDTTYKAFPEALTGRNSRVLTLFTELCENRLYFSATELTEIRRVRNELIAETTQLNIEGSESSNPEASSKKEAIKCLKIKFLNALHEVTHPDQHQMLMEQTKTEDGKCIIAGHPSRVKKLMDDLKWETRPAMEDQSRQPKYEESAAEERASTDTFDAFGSW
jgi:hypothetical protein